MTLETLLARFPGPVTLHASKTKWLVALAVCAIFVVGGASMLTGEQRTWVRLAAWSSVIFFGLGLLVAAGMMLPGASSLTLRDDGFEIVHLYRRTVLSWRAASGFEARRVGLQKIVVYDDAGTMGDGLAKVNASLVGRNAGLGDTYGLSADDLAAVMRQWRNRALGLG